MANKLGQGGYGPVYKRLLVPRRLPGMALWSKGKELDLIDDELADSLSSTEVKRCIRVALLCVQDHAENRPTMAAVISMLSSETELLQPKEPFFAFHNPSKFDQPEDNNPCPICEITMSLAEGQ
ncbi:hypothetical protein SLE2022_392970 [Rubroshorea leprosula]